MQLSIALKIKQVGEATYGDIGKDLIEVTCWRISDHPEFIGTLYPRDLQYNRSTFDFDCLQPILTLSMYPSSVDTNKDGFWSEAEVAEKRRILTSSKFGRENPKIGDLGTVMENMARYDMKHRPTSRSQRLGNGTFLLDMELWTNG